MAWTTPKTNWAVGELVTAEDMNAIGENLAALRNSPALRNSQEYVAAHTIASRMNVQSSQFADVDSNNLNLTITTTGGDVLVHFHGSVHLQHDEAIRFDIAVDGTRQGGDDGISYMSTYVNRGGWTRQNISFTRLIQSLNAGSHTFKLQVKTGQQITLHAGGQFWVREI